MDSKYLEKHLTFIHSLFLFLQYKKADPDEVVNAIIFLNLAYMPIFMYWLGRLYISLELRWKCIHLDN